MSKQELSIEAALKHIVSELVAMNSKLDNFSARLIDIESSMLTKEIDQSTSIAELSEATNALVQSLCDKLHASAQG